MPEWRIKGKAFVNTFYYEVAYVTVLLLSVVVCGYRDAILV